MSDLVDMQSLVTCVHLLASWQVLVAILLGLLYGALMGALPGVSASVAIASVLPFTFVLEPIVSIMLLTSIYSGGISGGAITAVLIGIPGTPGNVATVMDGFQMTRQGKAFEALGLSLIASCIGEFVSYVMLILLLKSIVRSVQYLGPADRAAICLAAITVIGALRGKSLTRGMIAAFFGLFLGTLGTSPVGVIRTKFLGFPALYGGLPIVPTLVGLVGFSELIGLLRQNILVDRKVFFSGNSVSNYLALLRHGLTVFKYRSSLVIGNILGYIIGILPGIGSAVASVVSYSVGKQLLDREGTFGTGDPRGVVVPESANNASEGGAMTILLALGIPGSGSAALVMSGFLMHGLQPGPLWIVKNLPFAYAVGVGNLFQALIFIVVGGIFMVCASRVVLLPMSILAPCLVVISTAGLYSLENSMFGVFVAWTFAYLGFFFKKYDYPTVALLLGFILAPTIDDEIYRTLAIYGGDWIQILYRPVVIASLFMFIASIVYTVLRQNKERTAV